MKMEFVNHWDDRGLLFSIESKQDIPFEIQRVFFISNVPKGKTRGNHVYKHNDTDQDQGCENTVSAYTEGTGFK